MMKKLNWCNYSRGFALFGILILIEGSLQAKEEPKEVPMYYVASSPTNRERVIPKRIEQQRTDETWMIPLLSTQRCAYEKAVQILNRYLHHCRQRRKAENILDEIEEYVSQVSELTKKIQGFGKKAWSCRHPVVRKLIHCLPSVRALQFKDVGRPYGGAFCDQAPYVTYVELETGFERSEASSNNLNMDQVVEEIAKDLGNQGIEAELQGQVTANSQFLRITIKNRKEDELQAILDLLLSKHTFSLKKALFAEIFLSLAGSKRSISYVLER